MVSISMEELEDRRDNDEGYCRNCQDWTADGVEPDARRYECPVCEKRTVYGAEEAFMMGLLEIIGD